MFKMSIVHRPLMRSILNLKLKLLIRRLMRALLRSTFCEFNGRTTHENSIFIAPNETISTQVYRPSIFVELLFRIDRRMPINACRTSQQKEMYIWHLDHEWPQNFHDFIFPSVLSGRINIKERIVNNKYWPLPWFHTKAYTCGYFSFEKWKTQISAITFFKSP